MQEMTVAVLRYIKEQYDVEPEFLWARSPNNAAFRHKGSRKWFAALLMDTPRRVLQLPGEGCVDILDVKCDPKLLGSLLDGQRYLPGYHMNKEHWVTLLLDGSLALQELSPLIDMSYQMTAGGGGKRITLPVRREYL